MRTESKIINAGIANALANAILPQPVDRKDHGLLVGVGAYAGEGALAIGYSKIFSKNVIMKLSSGIDTGKNISAGLSIGWHMEQ